MRRTLVIAGAAFVGLAIVAITTVALLLGNHRAPPPLGLSGTQQPGSASALTGTWKIGAGSQVGYRVKEKFINQPTETEAVARTSRITGGLEVAFRGATIIVSQMKFAVDLASLTSQDKYASYQVYQRDFFVRSVYLQTDSFPTATFSAGSAIYPAPLGGHVVIEVAGNLTVHGITKTETAHVQAQAETSGVEVAGSMTVDMRDFAIDPPSISFTQAEPIVTIEFDLKVVHA